MQFHIQVFSYIAEYQLLISHGLQTFKRSNVQISKFPNVQMFKRSNFQMSKRSNFKTFNANCQSS